MDPTTATHSSSSSQDSPSHLSENPTPAHSHLSETPTHHETHHENRATEFYGFVSWLLTHLAFALYLLWALVPARYIEAAGVDWYPSRQWAIILPAWSIVLIILTYLVYWSLAIFATPSFGDLSALTDSLAQYPPPNVPPAMHDMHLATVNRLLYRTHRKRPTPT